MTREDYIRHLISEKKLTVKSFSETIGMPYTTLLSMLKNGLGGASVDNVLKVCHGLHISVEELQQAENGELLKEPFFISGREKEVLMRYREKPEMHLAVHTLLGLEDAFGQNAAPLEETRVPCASRNGENETVKFSSDELVKLNQILKEKYPELSQKEPASDV